MMAAKAYSVNPAVTDERLPDVLAVLRFLAGPATQGEMAAELATVPVIPAVRNTPAVAGNERLQESLLHTSVDIGGGRTRNAPTIRAGYYAVPDYAESPVDAVEMLLRAATALRQLRSEDSPRNVVRGFEEGRQIRVSAGDEHDELQHPPSLAWRLSAAGRRASRWGRRRPGSGWWSSCACCPSRACSPGRRGSGAGHRRPQSGRRA